MIFIHNKKYIPKELKQILLVCNENFSHPRWVEKIDEYALKLSKFACVDIIESNGQVLGCNAYYINKETHSAFISIISIAQTHRNMHLGSTLLQNMERSLPPDVNSVKLEVRQSNKSAIEFYTRNGYKISEDNGSNYYMIKEI